jgi:HSP20 family protein
MEVDRLFDDWLPRRFHTEMNQVVPASDIEESENFYRITIEIPGVRKEDIKVDLLERQVSISGERRLETKREEANRVFSERKFGVFERRFSFPAPIDVSKVEANYHDGILQIMAPKAEFAKPRQLKITSHDDHSKKEEKAAS